MNGWDYWEPVPPSLFLWSLKSIFHRLYCTSARLTRPSQYESTMWGKVFAKKHTPSDDLICPGQMSVNLDIIRSESLKLHRRHNAQRLHFPVVLTHHRKSFTSSFFSLIFISVPLSESNKDGYFTHCYYKHNWFFFFYSYNEPRNSRSKIRGEVEDEKAHTHCTRMLTWDMIDTCIKWKNTYENRHGSCVVWYAIMSACQGQMYCVCLGYRLVPIKTCAFLRCLCGFPSVCVKSICACQSEKSQETLNRCFQWGREKT